MNPYVQPFVSLVDCLADFLGKHAEVVLHDLSDLEHSIIKIRNSHVSGRKVGDPITDLVIRQLQMRNGQKYKSNYLGLSRDGKSLKCASYFIRGANETVVGVLCVNLEIDHYLQAKEYLDSIFLGAEENNHHVKENLGQSIDEMMNASIEKALAKLTNKSRLSRDDKMRVIEEINREGVFLLKGAVATVAKHLKLSEPSVYRYLSQIPKAK